MTPYANRGGDSNVRLYENGDDFIRVQFSDGSIYLYNYESTGQADIEKMKNLAEQGQGLNAFISRVVRKRYARKER